MDVKIKKLTDTATIPTKAHPTDACFDIYADCPNEKYHWYSSHEDGDVYKEGIMIPPNGSCVIHTGFATEIPEGYFAPVFCRSGMGIKRHLRLCNSVGVIDSSYRGEWMVALHNDGKETQIINHGDRIAQFTILPVLDVNLISSESLDDTNRGSGGFGSTGA